jgi:hypothetical protein
VGVVEAKKVLAALARPPLFHLRVGLRRTGLIGLAFRFAFAAKLVSAHARIADATVVARARNNRHFGLYRVSRRNGALCPSRGDELVRGNAEHGARATPQARPDEEQSNTRLAGLSGLARPARLARLPWFLLRLRWLCDARLAAPPDPVFSRIQNGVARRHWIGRG